MGIDIEFAPRQTPVPRSGYLAEGIALDPAVQGLLLTAERAGRLHASTAGVALVRALRVKPAVVRVSGDVTARGVGVAAALAAAVQHSGTSTRAGDRDV